MLRQIIRCCAVAALRDKTWAKERVYDTDQRPIADAVLGDSTSPYKPYVVVYTDSDDFTNVWEAGLYDGTKRSMQLTLEIGAARSFQGTNGAIVVTFAGNDYAMELACDCIEDQIKAALWGAETERTDWGELLRRFAPHVTQVRSRRGGQNARGIRFNARRLIFIVQTLDEVVPGIVPPASHPVHTFISMAAAHTEENIVQAGDIISKLLASDPNDAPVWRQAQAQMGMDEAGITALNVTDTPLPYPEIEEAPYDPRDGDQPPQLETIIVREDDRGESHSTGEPA